MGARHGQGGIGGRWLGALAAIGSLLSGVVVLDSRVSGQEITPRIASTATDRADTHATRPPTLGGKASTATLAESRGNIDLALKMIADCKTRFAQVRDFSCTFQKRERVDGKLTQLHEMAMKMRNEPFSIYFKFARPNKGREAIYIAGKNGNKIQAHDVGWGKLLAGTMNLDPKGGMAMEENRHPVTEAGIGHLIETVQSHWTRELTPGESQVAIVRGATTAGRSCTTVEAVHTERDPSFLFHKVKVYIDDELGVPVRFEAYNWPTRAGEPPLLVEEYAYLNLKLDAGLSDHDFEPRNKAYSFGRF